jgi:CheY-like chemotaxis protein
MADEVAHCLAAGMTAHIGKPFDWTLLAEMIQSYLRESEPEVARRAC